MLESVTWDDRVWAVPYKSHTAMLWYNKDVFDEAGIDAEGIETWDDYLEAGRSIRNPASSSVMAHSRTSCMAGESGLPLISASL